MASATQVQMPRAVKRPRSHWDGSSDHRTSVTGDCGSGGWRVGWRSVKGNEMGDKAMSNLIAESNAVAEKLELLRTRAAIRSVDVANMLGTTPETVSRWNRGRAYPRPNKENLLVDLEYIVERLSEFYSDPRTARAWLYSRHKYFSGLRPADLIQEGRIQEVLEAIQAMANPTHT